MSTEIENLTRQLAEKLTLNGQKICTAESCTGGLIAKTLTDLAGSSEWFDRGFVTYSNQAKMDMLGVKAETLDAFGAVSEQTALEMVCGAILHSQAQVAIAVTGIAGPGGGSEAKPVGTVCFGFALGRQQWSELKHFEGNRQQVRKMSLVYAMHSILGGITRIS